MSNSEAVSLGWGCHSATTGVAMGIRSTKANGYKTCPFDEMASNYNGVIECIKDDFQYFCDTKYLELITIPKDAKHLSGETIVYNSKYKFIFNHESPGHANLYITQNWAKGINHYIINNYEEFINRYNRRIQNFKNLLASGKDIIFILTRYNTQMCDISELNTTIINKYPNLNFSFVFLDCDKQVLCDHLLLMNIDEDDEEVNRLL